MATIEIKTSAIESGIKKIIIEKLGIDNCEIPNDASFTNDLGIDSLDLYEILMEVEKEFKMKIDDENAEKLRTPGQLIQFVTNNFKISQL
ncbi:MAG TPA: acyl carrier protein [Puia sp.]|nr:acyl carrier protein [Puia sp.]